MPTHIGRLATVIRQVDIERGLRGVTPISGRSSGGTHKQRSLLAAGEDIKENRQPLHGCIPKTMAASFPCHLFTSLSCYHKEYSLGVSMVRVHKHPSESLRKFASSPHGPVVKWLRHCPFTAVTWVRVPSGSPQVWFHQPRRQKRAFPTRCAMERWGENCVWLTPAYK